MVPGKLTIMKKFFSLLISVCLSVSLLHAQERTGDSIAMKQNSIFLELSGLGLAYSINYDHLFLLKSRNKQGIGVRVGFSAFKFGLFGTKSRFTTIPLEAYYSFGRKFCGEFGLGNTFTFEDESHYSIQSFRLGGKYRGNKGLTLFLGGGMRIWKSDVLPLVCLGCGMAF